MITSRLVTAVRLNSAASPTFLSLTNVTNLTAAFPARFGHFGGKLAFSGIGIAPESAAVSCFCLRARCFSGAKSDCPVFIRPRARVENTTVGWRCPWGGHALRDPRDGQSVSGVLRRGGWFSRALKGIEMPAHSNAFVEKKEQGRNQFTILYSRSLDRPRLPRATFT